MSDLPRFARTEDEILACVKQGFCLVLEEKQAFLVEGLHKTFGLDRANIPADLRAAVAASGQLRELPEKEVAATCRPLHSRDLRKRKVYGVPE